MSGWKRSSWGLVQLSKEKPNRIFFKDFRSIFLIFPTGVPTLVNKLSTTYSYQYSDAHGCYLVNLSKGRRKTFRTNTVNLFLIKELVAICTSYDYPIPI